MLFKGQTVEDGVRVASLGVAVRNLWSSPVSNNIANNWGGFYFWIEIDFSTLNRWKK
jgi:hypothetical protein